MNRFFVYLLLNTCFACLRNPFPFWYSEYLPPVYCHSFKLFYFPLSFHLILLWFLNQIRHLYLILLQFLLPSHNSTCPTVIILLEYLIFTMAVLKILDEWHRMSSVLGSSGQKPQMRGPWSIPQFQPMCFPFIWHHLLQRPALSHFWLVGLSYLNTETVSTVL